MGFAVCDSEEIVATPLCVVHVKSMDQAVGETARVMHEVGADRIVVGLPLNMDGTRGPAVARVETFMERLRQDVAAPVGEWDERLTTSLVERMLIQADVRRQTRREVRDMLAAQAILQSFLDARASARARLDEEHDGEIHGQDQDGGTSGRA